MSRVDARRDLDLGLVAELLHRADTYAAVTQTGGQCVTLFAGPPGLVCADAGCEHRLIAVGPGWVSEMGTAPALASLDDLSIVRDGHDEQPEFELRGVGAASPKQAVADSVLSAIAVLRGQT